jgi:hypothetical protein
MENTTAAILTGLGTMLLVAAVVAGLVWLTYRLASWSRSPTRPPSPGRPGWCWSPASWSVSATKPSTSANRSASSSPARFASSSHPKQPRTPSQPQVIATARPSPSMGDTLRRQPRQDLQPVAVRQDKRDRPRWPTACCPGSSGQVRHQPVRSCRTEGARGMTLLGFLVGTVCTAGGGWEGSGVRAPGSSMACKGSGVQGPQPSTAPRRSLPEVSSRSSLMEFRAVRRPPAGRAGGG